MGKAANRLTKGTSAHGNAGEASIFLVLADRKIKRDGTLALVMPLSLMSGEAWQASRMMLAKNYSDLVLVSIAGFSDNEMSFSADTGMGECLVVGCKSGKGGSRATFVILKERPAYPLLGATAANELRNLINRKAIRRLEDGPVGGTAIRFGDDLIGQVIEAPFTSLRGRVEPIADFRPFIGTVRLSVGRRTPRLASFNAGNRRCQSADRDRAEHRNCGSVSRGHKFQPVKRRNTRSVHYIRPPQGSSANISGAMEARCSP